MKQRWLLVFSQQAFEREQATFERGLDKQEEKLATDLWHLENKNFATEDLARAKLEEVQKAYPFHPIAIRIVPQLAYRHRGRPKVDTPRQVFPYTIEVTGVQFDVAAAQKVLNKKGRFVLATNETDESVLSDETVLSEYKLQQDVERAHSFLKGTEFGLTDIYLKNPSRIAALMAVMTLCLMVYNVAQFELRQQLKANDETLPSQVNKPTAKPTLRWVMQLFMDIQVVAIEGHPPIITNNTSLREKILEFFPPAVRRIYGRDAPTAHS